MPIVDCGASCEVIFAHYVRQLKKWGEFKELLVELDMDWQVVRTRMQDSDRRIEAHAQSDQRCTRIRALVGVGPTCLAFIEFSNGMQVGSEYLSRREWGQDQK